MADTTYRVVTEFATRGNLGGELANVGAIARSVQDAIGGVVGRALDIGTTLAKVGAVAGLAMVARDTVHLNKELENTKISLAAIFGAQGITSNMQEDRKSVV